MGPGVGAFKWGIPALGLLEHAGSAGVSQVAKASFKGRFSSQGRPIGCVQEEALVVLSSETSRTDANSAKYLL